METFLNKLKSLSYTFGADIIADVVIGLSFGFATLLETGDYTAAAIIGLATAVARTALADSLRKGAKKLKELKANKY